MPEPVLTVPQKKRELLHRAMDSKRWDGFPFRDGDVVIGTWAKSGTTWRQQIVTQLIHQGRAINKGTNNRWRDTVSANLSPDCAAWLAGGSRRIEINGTILLGCPRQNGG